jgi:hypothetical protein
MPLCVKPNYCKTMNIQYNTLFRINLKHNYYANGLCPDFDIVPTAECQVNLRRFGLGAKQIGGILVVYFEQSPATSKPRLKLADWTRFGFTLQLRQYAFYNYTVLPNSTLPFFFSNLNENGVEKAPNTEGVILSKTNTPSTNDLLELKPNAFTAHYPLGTTALNVSIFRPQTGFQLAKTIEIRPLTTSTAVSLPDFQSGFMKIENNSSPTPQYVYSDARVASNRPFGIIEIWKSAATDYTTPQVFTLNWARKKDFWRYFVLKKEVQTEESPPEPTNLYIEVKNQKAPEYPENVAFNLVNEIDITAAEKLIISNYTDVKVYLFRSMVELPQFERPLGKIHLSDLVEGIDMQLSQPTFRSTDTNIIVKIQKN